MAIYKRKEQINAHKWTEYCSININSNFYTIRNGDYIIAEDMYNIKIIPKDIFELVYEPNEFI